jgi:hypothetical protein
VNVAASLGSENGRVLRKSSVSRADFGIVLETPRCAEIVTKTG